MPDPGALPDQGEIEAVARELADWATEPGEIAPPYRWKKFQHQARCAIQALNVYRTATGETNSGVWQAWSSEFRTKYPNRDARATVAEASETLGRLLGLAHMVAGYDDRDFDLQLAQHLINCRFGLQSLVDRTATGVGEDTVVVPVEPPLELLVSMAVREDHGLGVPGYYDQPFLLAVNHGITHAQMMDAAISTMRKLYEEVVGTGFYAPKHAERYRAMLAPPPKAGATK